MKINVKRTVAGVAAGVAITGALVLADAVIFNPPEKPPVSATTLEYLPRPSLNENFEPKAPVTDNNSVLPQDEQQPKLVEPPKADPAPLTHGDTLFFPPRPTPKVLELPKVVPTPHDLAPPEPDVHGTTKTVPKDNIRHQTLIIEPDPDLQMLAAASHKKKEGTGYGIELSGVITSDTDIGIGSVALKLGGDYYG